MYESKLQTKVTTFYKFIRDMTVVSLVIYLKGKRHYGTVTTTTLEPPFNVARFKVFCHLMFNFDDPKSICLVLTDLHSRFQFSVKIHWSPKKP
jgi:hypothetical protein